MTSPATNSTLPITPHLGVYTALGTTMSIQWIIYLAGVVVLGLFQAQAKAAIDNGVLFVLAVLAYLVLLRLLGYYLTKLWDSRTQTPS